MATVTGFITLADVADGADGAAAAPAGAVSGTWTPSTDTTPDSNGEMHIRENGSVADNNEAWANIIEIRVYRNESGGTNHQASLRRVGVGGSVVLYKSATQWAGYRVTAVNVSATNYTTFTLTHLASEGNLGTYAQALQVYWTPAGATGATGAAGNDGNDGARGRRTVTGIAYSNATGANAPTLPTNSNATWNFTNSAFTGNSFAPSSGTPPWTLTPPTESATQANPYHQSRFTVVEGNTDGTSNTTFATARTRTQFTGVVTFTSNGNITDGNSNQTFGNLASSNTTLGNIATANSVNLANQTTGDVSLTNQVSGAGNLAAANAVNYTNQVNSKPTIPSGNLANSNATLGNLASANTVNYANEINATPTLGNLASSNTTLGNLASANAVNAGNQVNGTVANAQLGNINAASLNSNNTNTTTIDGGAITTGTIDVGQLFVGGSGQPVYAGKWTDSSDTTPEANGELFFSESTGTDRMETGDAWTRLLRLRINRTDVDGRRFDDVFGKINADSIISIYQLNSNGTTARGATYQVSAISGLQTGNYYILTIAGGDAENAISTFTRDQTYHITIFPNAQAYFSGDVIVDGSINASKIVTSGITITASQVNDAGNLATANAVNAANQLNAAGNLATANAVNLTNQVNGAGNLAAANAVNLTNQANDAGNLATANAVNVTNEVNGINQNTLITAANAADARTAISAGTGNGNSNLTNTNVSIGGGQINSGTIANARLNENVSLKGNTGNLFASTTNISGGQINTGIVTGGALTINATNYQPNAGNGGFALGIPASGTGAGRFVVGSADEYLWWDGSTLRIRGEIENVTTALLQGEGLPSGQSVEFNSNTELSGALTGIFGAGVYVAILWGGGGGGGAFTNSANNNGTARGGGSGGMAICAFEYDGTTALNASLGNGGAGGSTGRDYVTGGAGGASNLTLGTTVIMTANGGSAGGGNNNSRPGGTGVVNIANNNALFASANTNTTKGSTTNNTVSAGAGVVIPTIEASDANLTARPSSNNGGAAGGSMLGNQVGTNSNSNNVQTRTSNYVSGWFNHPQIAGSAAGLGGVGYETTGSGPNGGGGGRFAGGGAQRSVFGAGNAFYTSGSGNRGGGGAGCRTGRNNTNPSTGGGAGGSGGLIIAKL